MYNVLCVMYNVGLSTWSLGLSFTRNWGGEAGGSQPAIQCSVIHSVFCNMFYSINYSI